MKNSEENQVQVNESNKLAVNAESIKKLKEEVVIKPEISTGQNNEIRVSMGIGDVKKHLRKYKQEVDADIDSLASESKKVHEEVKLLKDRLATVDEYIATQSSMPIVDPAKIEYLQAQAEKYDKRREEAEGKAIALQEKMVNSAEVEKIDVSHDSMSANAQKLKATAVDDKIKQEKILDSATEVKNSLNEMKKETKDTKKAIDEKIKNTQKELKNTPDNIELQTQINDFKKDSDDLNQKLNEINKQKSEINDVIKQAKNNINTDKKAISFSSQIEKDIQKQMENLGKTRSLANVNVINAQKIETIKPERKDTAKSEPEPTDIPTKKTRSEEIKDLGEKGKDQQDKVIVKGFFDKLQDNFNMHRYQKDFSGEVHDTFTPRKKNPVKFVGNMANAAINGVGAFVKTSTEYMGQGLVSIAEKANKPLDAARNNFDNAKGTGSRVGWGFAVAGASLIKFGGSVLSVTGKGVEAAGRATHDGMATLGQSARAMTSLIFPDENTPWAFKAAISTASKFAANTAQIATDMVKETGTQLRDVGNRVKVPGVSQALKAIGSTTQAIAQATEGLVQGGRKILTFEPKEGFTLLTSGIGSAAKTFGSGIKQAMQETKLEVSKVQVKKLNEKIDKTQEEELSDQLKKKRDQKLESLEKIQSKLDEKPKQAKDTTKQEAKVAADKMQIAKLDEKIQKKNNKLLAQPQINEQTKSDQKVKESLETKISILQIKRDQKKESLEKNQNKLDEKAKQTEEVTKPETIKVRGIDHNERIQRAIAGTTDGKTVEQHLEKRKELYAVDREKRSKMEDSFKKTDVLENELTDIKSKRQEILNKWTGHHSNQEGKDQNSR